MKKIEVILPFMMVLTMLSGCQTTSTVNTNPNNIDPNDLAMAQLVVATSCTLSSNKGSKEKKAIDVSNVIIFGYDKGKDGWVRTDSKISGARNMRRNNVYYNFDLNEVYCGSRSWNSSGYNSGRIF